VAGCAVFARIVRYSHELWGVHPPIKGKMVWNFETLDGGETFEFDVGGEAFEGERFAQWMRIS
jgi:hypothetical protein